MKFQILVAQRLLPFLMQTLEKLKTKFLILIVQELLLFLIGEAETVSGLAKKTVYIAKISEGQGKYITTTNYNKFRNVILDAKVKPKKVSQQI